MTARDSFISALAEAAEKYALRKAVFSSPTQSATRKLTITPVLLRGETVYRLERLTSDGKAAQENVKPDALPQLASDALGDFSRANIYAADLEASYMRAKSGRETALGCEKLRRALGCAQPVAPAPHDREKNRILTGAEPFLRGLGLADENGRVYDRAQAKFRQICRFLEYLRDVTDELPDSPVVADLCCGKSYLSFAVYHWLCSAGRRPEMYCVDIKPDVIEYCSALADKLGFDSMRFYCADVKSFDLPGGIDLAVSLHACDTLTDIVLDFAARKNARVILSTPCCHAELARTIGCEPLSFAAKYPYLRRRLCEPLTDALRCARLESQGYAVETLELVDPSDTPKNMLIRAVRLPDGKRSAEAAAKAAAGYEKALAFLGLERDFPFQ